MCSKKEHSAQIFGVIFFLEYESLTVYFVAVELYGQGDTKEFRRGDLPFTEIYWGKLHSCVSGVSLTL